MNKSALNHCLLATCLGLTFCCHPATGQSTNPTVNRTTLTSYDGTHPRLLLDSSSLSTLRKNATTAAPGSRWAKIWALVKANADLWSAKPPPPYAPPVGANKQQLSQRDNGNAIADFALMYLLTKSTQPSVDTRWFEAEDAVLAAPMALQADPTADGGRSIGTPAGGAANTDKTLTSAVYNVSTARTTNYHLLARILAPDAATNTFYVGLDDAPSVLVSVTNYGGWTWAMCGGWSLTPGNHRFRITYQKSGVSFDNFVLSSDFNFSPSGLGTEQHSLDASAFALSNAATYALNQGADALALSGAFLAAPAGVASRTSPPAAGTTGDAQVAVGVNGGGYDVWAHFKAPDGGKDTFYFAVDGGAYAAVTLAGGGSNVDWVWQKVNASTVSLAAGTHVLKVSNGKTGCEVDRLFVATAGTPAPLDPNKYLAAACLRAITSCNYADWGADDQANGLAAAAQLTGLSLFYDWCYSDLGTLDRAKILAKLQEKGAEMYHAAAGDNYQGILPAWWRGDWIINHLWSDLNGLAFAGAAIHGEPGSPDTVPWLQTALTGINNALTYLPRDGADHEGPDYWGAVEDILRFGDLSKKLLGVDVTTGSPWLGQTALWRMYMNTATNYWNPSGPLVRWADCDSYVYTGPDYQLRKLASVMASQPASVTFDATPVSGLAGCAQWLADVYDDNGHNSFNGNPTTGGNPYLDLLWYDPTITSTAPNGVLDPFGHFDDLDEVIARTDWAGSEAIVGLQCGPAAGHNYLRVDSPYIDWGTNHVHPAVNSFCFYDYGQWQVENVGYAYKKTAYENTLLVGGKGQAGEKATADLTFVGTAAAAAEDPADAQGQRTRNPGVDANLSYSSEPFDYIVGQGAGAYPVAMRLNSFKRRLLFLKPHVLVVVDDIAMRPSHPATLQLCFYPWQALEDNPAHTVVSPNEYVFSNNDWHYGKSSVTDFKALITPADMAYTAVSTVGEFSTSDRWALSLSSNGAVENMSTAMAITTAPLNGTPPNVTAQTDAGDRAWKFKVGSRTMVLDRTDETARLVTVVEAESATPASPVTVYADDTAAGGGRYVMAAPGTSTNDPDHLTAPSVAYSFTTPTTGNYTLWARVRAADVNSASFYYYLNPPAGYAGAYPATGTATAYGAWQWVKLGTGSFSATTPNVLALKYRQAGCKIDQFILTGDGGYTPSGRY